jgi:ribosome recycling factor
VLFTAAGRDGPTGSARDLELRALEAAVVAMREALERTELGAKDRVQAALAQAAAEAEQLKTVITNLRDELEVQHARHLEALQQQKQLAADEVRQLQATIQAMRDELEAKSR